MEKRRISVENDTVTVKFLKALKKLNLGGVGVETRIAMLQVLIKHDLSGREWDDDYDPKNG